MRKLSLYLKQHLSDHIRVGIWKKVPQKEDILSADDRMPQIWIGDAAVIAALKQMTEAADKNGEKLPETRFVTMTEDPEAAQETTLYAYQSCENLMRFICRICQDCVQSENGIQTRGFKHSLLVIGTGNLHVSFPWAVALAEQMSGYGRSILLDLVPCSGMEQLLELEEAGDDIGDFFWRLRKNAEADAANLIRRMQKADYCAVGKNPLILGELQGEDMDRLSGKIRQSGCVSAVFLQENPGGLSRELFRRVEAVCCLDDGSVSAGNRSRCIREFYRSCMGNDRGFYVQHVPAYAAEETGRHLIGEWSCGIYGRMAREWMAELYEEKEGRSQDE